MKKRSLSALSRGVLVGTLATAALAPTLAQADVTMFGWLYVTEKPRITYTRSTGKVTVHDHGSVWLGTQCGSGWYVSYQGYTAGSHSVKYTYPDRRQSEDETPTTAITYLAQAFEEEIEDFAIKYKKRVNLPLELDAFPNTISEEKVRSLARVPIGLISMGIQSASRDTLKNIYNRPTPIDWALTRAAVGPRTQRRS